MCFTPMAGDCTDSNQYAGYCPYWVSRGFCDGQYQGFMMDHCKKSCNACEGEFVITNMISSEQRN